MQEYFYAQTDDERIVIGVTHAAGLIEGVHMVPIESLDASLMGKRWNPQAQAFEPGPPPPVPTERNVSRKAFLSRFTDAEAIDIDMASIGATREAATVRRYLSKVNAAQHIDLADDETRTGVQALEAAGLLQPGRALVILDAPIEPKELP